MNSPRSVDRNVGLVCCDREKKREQSSRGLECFDRPFLKRFGYTTGEISWPLCPSYYPRYYLKLGKKLCTVLQAIQRSVTPELNSVSIGIQGKPRGKLQASAESSRIWPSRRTDGIKVLLTIVISYLSAFSSVRVFRGPQRRGTLLGKCHWNRRSDGHTELQVSSSVHIAS